HFVERLPDETADQPDWPTAQIGMARAELAPEGPLLPRVVVAVAEVFVEARRRVRPSVIGECCLERGARPQIAPQRQNARRIADVGQARDRVDAALSRAD